MPGHTEIFVKPPVKREDPREVESNYPTVPLQETVIEPEPMVYREEEAGVMLGVQLAPDPAAPPTETVPSPLDGRPVFDLSDGDPADDTDPGGV